MKLHTVRGYKNGVFTNVGQLGNKYALFRRSITNATIEFHQCGMLTSVDADKPLQPPFKRRNSK